MIIVKDGHSQLNGTRADLLEETALLFDSLLDVAPEVLIICFNSYNDEILQTIYKANPHLMKMLVDIIDSIHKENKWVNLSY